VTCGNCIDACPNSSAYKRSGVLVLPTINSSVSALFEKIKPHLELLRDIGGITFSGGEPLIQHKALSVLAKKCKDSGFHTALETSGIVPVEYIQDIYPFIDTWLIGMRLTNGHDNNTDLFEKNTRNTLSYLTKNSCKEIIARFPVIPRFTTSESDLSKVYDILVEYGIKKIEVLPLNPETSHYYNAMDLPAYFEGNEINTNNEFKSVFDFFNKN
jgi:pyruvate formate lyase activating enzyme